MNAGFEREVLERLTKIETKLDDYGGTKEKTEKAYTQSNENKKDIEELQDKIKWISRTSIGAIITGLIGLLFALMKVKIGG